MISATLSCDHGPAVLLATKGIGGAEVQLNWACSFSRDGSECAFQSQKASAADIEAYVTGAELVNSYIGDANLDGEFGSRDLVAIFDDGKYETAEAANWSEGDWNGDGRFGTADLVFALGGGGYELGPRVAVAAVPEPANLAGALLAALSIVCRRRRP